MTHTHTHRIYSSNEKPLILNHKNVFYPILLLMNESKPFFIQKHNPLFLEVKNWS